MMDDGGMSSSAPAVLIAKDPMQPSMASLPREITLKVFKLLDPPTKGKAEATCKFFLTQIRQTWYEDVTTLTISGSFLGDELSKEDFDIDAGRILAHVLRCGTILTVIFEIGWGADRPATNGSIGMQFIYDYGHKFCNVTSIRGVIGDSTSRAITFIMQQSATIVEHVNLAEFSRPYRQPDNMCIELIIEGLQGCCNVKDITMEVRSTTFNHLLVALQNKHIRNVKIRFLSSTEHELTQQIISLCQVAGFGGQLRSLSFGYNMGFVSITQIYHSIPFLALQTIEHLSICVRQGPKYTMVSDLMNFARLEVITFDCIVWSTNSIHRIVNFIIELLHRAGELRKELVCELKMVSPQSADFRTRFESLINAKLSVDVVTFMADGVYFTNKKFLSQTAVTLPPIPSQSSESTSQDFCLKRLFERNQPFEMVNDEVESEPKEEIETPVMESSSTTDQGPPPTTFLVLPTEVILKIFKVLDVKSKVKFERVCQRFRRHLLQTWSDVTHLVISGAFVGGLLHGDELEFELCRVRCYLMRCDSFSSVMAELDCIEHCNPRTQRSTGFLLLECYSAMFNNVTKVVGILSHSTKLTIFHIIQQCLHSLEEITLSSFSSDAKHHRGVLGMWDTLIGYLQDADSIKKIDIEVPGFALERLLEFMQNKQPRSVVLDVASSHMDNLTQNIIAVADTMSFHGQLRTLSFSFCTGIVSITDVFHGFTDIARETLRSLLISVRQGPKMEIVVDLLPFQELSDLVFNNLDWSKNCRRRVIAFAIELFVQSPHLNSKLVCKLKFRSALTNDRVEDFCNRIIEARNNVPPAAGLVMNLHSDLAINKIILANDYVEISIC